MSASLLGRNLVPTLVVLMAIIVVWYVMRDDDEQRETLRMFAISFMVGVVILYTVLGMLYYPGA